MRYVALLRAINVGKRKLAMADLRALCDDLGFDEPRTYVNSGNVVFDASGSAKSVEAALEKGLKAHCGFEVPTIVRTKAQWSKLVKANPFPKATKATPNFVQLFVSKGKVPAKAAGTIEEKGRAGESAAIAGGALWIHYPKGIGPSKLTATIIDAAVGHASTGRNFRTVLELEKILDT